MTPKPKTTPADPFSTTEKVMQTFRMPREIVGFLRGDGFNIYTRPDRVAVGRA